MSPPPPKKKNNKTLKRKKPRFFNPPPTHPFQQTTTTQVAIKPNDPTAKHGACDHGTNRVDIRIAFLDSASISDDIFDGMEERDVWKGFIMFRIMCNFYVIYPIIPSSSSSLNIWNLWLPGKPIYQVTRPDPWF